MRDWRIDLSLTGSFVAWAGWLVGAALIVADLLTPGDDLGHVGIMLGAAGHLAHVRGMFCAQAAAMKEAFELGRDAGRLEAVPTLPPQRIH